MRPSLRSGAGSIRRALSDDIGATVPVRLDEEREGELLQNLTFAYLPRGALHSRGRPLTTACTILSGNASVGLRTEYVVGDVRKFGFSVCGCILTSTPQIDIRAREAMNASGRDEAQTSATRPSVPSGGRCDRRWRLHKHGACRGSSDGPHQQRLAIKHEGGRSSLTLKLPSSQDR